MSSPTLKSITAQRRIIKALLTGVPKCVQERFLAEMDRSLSRLDGREAGEFLEERIRLLKAMSQTERDETIKRRDKLLRSLPKDAQRSFLAEPENADLRLGDPLEPATVFPPVLTGIAIFVGSIFVLAIFVGVYVIAFTGLCAVFAVLLSQPDQIDYPLFDAGLGSRLKRSRRRRKKRIQQAAVAGRFSEGVVRISSYLSAGLMGLGIVALILGLLSLLLGHGSDVLAFAVIAIIGAFLVSAGGSLLGGLVRVQPESHAKQTSVPLGTSEISEAIASWRFRKPAAIGFTLAGFAVPVLGAAVSKL